MSRIEWNESLSVSNDELDHQHQMLFELYNKLHEAMLNDSPERLNEVRLASLTALMEYISHHFKAEEQHMQAIGYPDFSKHQLQHISFANQITRRKQDINEGKTFLISSLLKFLRNWIQDHIREEDAKYAVFQNESQ